ncbi:MAG: UbiA family prenyltransferase [Nitrospirae bacterium]|nr:UbiA family prenyltransferase [Nitrospirota bacterium]
MLKQVQHDSLIEQRSYFRRSELKKIIEKLRILLEMIKFPHTIFALPFAFMGAILAEKRIPSWNKILWITVAMVGVRSAAMSFNRLADWRFDALNPRTKDRALPKGLLTPLQVIVFIIIASTIFIYAASRLNPLAFKLSPLALLIIFFYSYTKRFTHFSHFFLGLSLSLAPIGAWIGIKGVIELPALLLGGAVVFWLIGFDILYALQDIDFDKKIGLRSIPAKLGIKKSLFISRISHFITVVLLLSLYPLLKLGYIYLIGLVAVTGLFIKEHSLVKETDLSKLDMAFFNMNGYISVAIFVFTLFDILIPLP